MAPSAAAGSAAGGNGGDGLREFLVLFAHHNMYFNMRFQELEAIAGLIGVPSRDDLYVDVPAPTALSASPLALVRLPSEEAARKLCERAVLIKAVLEVWATGSSYEDLVEQALAAGEGARQQRRRFLAPPQTFQIRVAAFGRTASMEDKRGIFNALRPLFDGDEIANLQEPDTTVWALEEHSHQTEEKTHLGPRSNHPNRIFVCRQVAGGRSIDKKLKSGDKAYFQKYDLSQRAVLGPTTLDNELAFIMANCACVQEGQVALEPFCGTGGLLVAMSHFGARLIGGEIDIRVVKGWRVAYTKNKDAAQESVRARGLPAMAEPSAPAKGANGTSSRAAGVDIGTVLDRGSGAMQLGYLAAIGLTPELCPASSSSSSSAAPAGQSEEGAGKVLVKDGSANHGRDIFTNFVQYQAQLPEIVVCDNSTRPWRKVGGGWCDCIVTDPPYGVRAGAKKQGRDPERGLVEIRDLATYIPPKVSYGEDELAEDLLDLASEALHDNGRLVFLAPVDLADFLGIDRAAAERGGGPRGSLHGTVFPKDGRKKDPRLCISETTRDPLLLDEARYADFLPAHRDMELVGASLQILSGGLGRLLVTMRRRPRGHGGASAGAK